MNKQQEQEAIDLLLAGNALMDLRALVRNAPRDHSLRAMLEFLEGTAEYIAKVEALIRALEPTLAAKRPDLAGVGAPSLRDPNAAKLAEIFSAPRPYEPIDPGVCLAAPESPGLGGRTHGTIDGRWCVYCGAFKTHAGWRRPANASQNGVSKSDPTSPAQS